MKKLFKSKTFLSAVLSIALCVSLIAGATFAIFTSEANVNIAVTSGTVKVTAEINEKELKTYSGVEITGSEDDEIVETTSGTFTNGGTAKVEGNTIKITKMTAGDKVTFPVNIKNESNVNIKYRMRISIADDTGLASELNIKIGDYSGRYVTIWEDLEPGKGDKTLECEIALPTTSTAQGESCTISLLAEAVQGNAAVSNDEHYPVDTASFNEALKYGGNVFVERNIEAEDVLVSESTATIDMNEKTVANTNDIWNTDNDAWSLLSARGEGVELTVAGNGKFLAKENDCYAVDVQDGANLIIKNGTFIGNIHAVYVEKGTLTVEGGFFAIQQLYPDKNNDFAKQYGFVLNCLDANRANGTASIVVKGGTFVNFNPADCWAEGEHTNFLEKGYSVVSEDQENGDVWYTVVKGTGVVPGTQEELNTGITESTTKDVTVIVPKNATVTIDNGIANEGAKARDIIFEGDGTQTVDVITNAVTAEGGELNHQRGSTFTFRNLTIQAGEGSFDGIVCDELRYENCVIKGKLTLYGKATFINCTFENDMANQYSIWTWGGTDVTFEGCTFNTNGKAILLYGKATAEKPTNLVVKNCTFNDRRNGAAGKAAIEIGNDYNATYTLTVDNATVNGFTINVEGKNTGSKLWGNKNSMDAEHLTVTIDGTKIQ